MDAGVMPAIWRPSNLVNPYRKDELARVFEEGAAAMLRSLISNSIEVDLNDWEGTANQVFVFRYLYRVYRGSLVFIPDGQVKG